MSTQRYSSIRFRRLGLGFVSAALVGVCTPAQAHFFTQPYTLPVPFAMYAWSAAAALILSFVVVGLFAVPKLRPPVTDQDTSSSRVVPMAIIRVGRAGSVLALAVCVITGWFGTQASLENLSMTLFWIVFVLFVPYLCAFLGDYYAAISPWRTLVAVAERYAGRPFTGAFAYPARASYWPALALYIVFIWIELFGQFHPSGLANTLLIYTALNFIGAWAFGTRVWFHYGEFFAVFLRLISSMAPVAWHTDNTGRDVRISLRPPFSELAAMKAESLAMAVFILFMLSSTAFDGLHGTQPWVNSFWKYVYPVFAPLLGASAPEQIAAGTWFYHDWQVAIFLMSPAIYLVIFWICITLARQLSKTSLGMRDLILRFAPSLIPIAFVYHATHYYTILLAQGSQLPRLISDPFGAGWNLLGISMSHFNALLLQVDFIWHSQVALILIGHIISVYLAHIVALRVFGGPGAAAASQVPMLVLMVLFTTFGLWILSLPLTAGG